MSSTSPKKQHVEYDHYTCPKCKANWHVTKGRKVLCFFCHVPMNLRKEKGAHNG